MLLHIKYALSHPTIALECHSFSTDSHRNALTLFDSENSVIAVFTEFQYFHKEQSTTTTTTTTIDPIEPIDPGQTSNWPEPPMPEPPAPPEPKEWVDDEPTIVANSTDLMELDARAEGREAAANGESIKACPYEFGDPMRPVWRLGFRSYEVLSKK